MPINIPKTLFIITGVGWLVTLSTFLFPIHTFEAMLWAIMIWAMTGLSCVSVAVFLITRQKTKEVWLRQSILKKIAFFAGILLSTTITAVIAFIIMSIISLNRDPRPIS